MRRASGATIEDVDGNRFIDYVMSWGPLIHGHAPRGLVKAITTAARAGTSFGAPSPLEPRAGRARTPPRAIDGAHPVRQLRHRGDDERHSRGACVHRPRPDREVRRVLSRTRRRLPSQGWVGCDDTGCADEPWRAARGCRRYAADTLQRPWRRQSTLRRPAGSHRRHRRGANRRQHGSGGAGQRAFSRACTPFAHVTGSS